ncbi:protein of unknown function [Streptococcus thermophilus]|jgi:hypothetical protein|nr:protein of unknown function [Streptococcus thermophilus]CAD0170822.1 protein of unknown function [Streptococcus thermophilus]
MTCVIHCYAVLAIVSNSYPPLQGRLPTRYSPVRNSSKKSKLLSSAFYLHVLGTPPAFVLSQDQTLINTLIIVRALTHYRRLTIYSCKLTGYNSSIITLHLVSYSVLKGLNREDRIRTCDPLVPNQVLYQAELLPDKNAP